MTSSPSVTFDFGSLNSICAYLESTNDEPVEIALKIVPEIQMQFSRYNRIDNEETQTVQKYVSDLLIKRHVFVEFPTSPVPKWYVSVLSGDIVVDCKIYATHQKACLSFLQRFAVEPQLNPSINEPVSIPVPENDLEEMEAVLQACKMFFHTIDEMRGIPKGLDDLFAEEARGLLKRCEPFADDMRVDYYWGQLFEICQSNKLAIDGEYVDVGLEVPKLDLHELITAYYEDGVDITTEQRQDLYDRIVEEHGKQVFVEYFGERRFGKMSRRRLLDQIDYNFLSLRAIILKCRRDTLV